MIGVDNWNVDFDFMYCFLSSAICIKCFDLEAVALMSDADGVAAACLCQLCQQRPGSRGGA